MASGTGGYNAGAYGDNGWNDAALISESGIAANLAFKKAINSNKEKTK